MNDFVVLTCEHGGNRVPAEFAPLFKGRSELLASHRGYDPGALDLARTLARRLRTPLYAATVTRLLVELNRSPGHRDLFSSVTKVLDRPAREAILRKYYRPYREGVEAEIEAATARGMRVVHLSIHTFVSVLDGAVRRADVGLLYDPRRPVEVEMCSRLKRAISARRADLHVRMNYPYRGAADGFTTAMRKKWPAARYAGIEIEVNQRWPLGDRADWRGLERDLAEAISAAVPVPGRSR